MKQSLGYIHRRTNLDEHDVLKLVFLLLVSIATRLSDVSANCPTPPSINGANITSPVSPPFLEGAEIQYHCLIGYDEHASSRTWRCDGTHWVGGDLTCEARLCSFLDPPQNGYISNEPSYEPGSYIHFACDEGYSLEGSRKLRCRIDGWVGSVPKCNINFCEDFVGVDNGDVFQESPDGVYNDYGSVISVTCSPGFVLNGSPRITCGADGQWSDSPTCQSSICPTYPVSSSSCTDEAIIEGTLYILYCKDNTDSVSVTRIGPDDALCMGNVWTDTSMACFCNCKISSNDDEFIVFHNLDSRGFLEHGALLSWGCKNGARKASTDQLVCHDGAIGEAKCIPPPTTTTSTTPSTTTSTTTETPSTTSSTTSSTSTSTASSTTSSTSTSTTSLTTSSTSTSTTSSTTSPTITSSTSKIPSNATSIKSVSSTLKPIVRNKSNQIFDVCKCNCIVTEDTGLIQKHQEFESDVNRLLNLPRNCYSNRISNTVDKLDCSFTKLGTLSCVGPSLSEEHREMLTSDETGRITDLERVASEVCMCGKQMAKLSGSANKFSSTFLPLICFYAFLVLVYIQ